MTPRTGLVLTGGGARAAYQAGALAALAECTLGTAAPFPILTGISAGAINAAFLAAAGPFDEAARKLAALWSQLTPDAVYRTGVLSLSGLGARWLRDLSGAFGGGRINHLLDTAPLGDLLRHAIPVERIHPRIAAGELSGVAVTALRYSTRRAVTFFDAGPPAAEWERSARAGVRATLTVDHVLASAAMPVLFPPVRMNGEWYADGGVRMSAPLSPAIHLGADRIVAIGVRPGGPVEARRGRRGANIALAEIVDVLLDAIFVDTLDGDVERLTRINGTVSAMSEARRRALAQPLRVVPALVLRPSQPLGSLASRELGSLPFVLGRLLRGLGADDDRGWELLSYLAFEPAYLERLMTLGYDDTRERSADIQRFLGEERAAA